MDRSSVLPALAVGAAAACIAGLAYYQLSASIRVRRCLIPCHATGRADRDGAAPAPPRDAGARAPLMSCPRRRPDARTCRSTSRNTSSPAHATTLPRRPRSGEAIALCRHQRSSTRRRRRRQRLPTRKRPPAAARPAPQTVHATTASRCPTQPCCAAAAARAPGTARKPASKPRGELVCLTSPVHGPAILHDPSLPGG